MPKTPFLAIALLTFVAAASAQAQDDKMITLSGHTDKVYATAFLPDGKVVTASFDRTVKIWDVEAAKVERTLEGHTDIILALAASPDGKKIASAGKERVIKLWDLGSSDAPKDISGHSRSVYHVTFSPDGKLLASCGEDDTRIMIWDVEQAKSIKQLNAEHPDDKNQRRSIFCVEFSPDGKQLVSCGADRTVRIWNVESGKEVRRLEGAEYVVFKEKDKKIERTVRKGGSNLALYTVAFSPDGKLIAAGGLEKTIRIWDAASGQLKQTITGHPDFVYDVQFNENGTRLLSSGHGGNLFVWSVPNGDQRLATKLPSLTFCATLSPDRTQVAVACGDTNAYLLDIQQGN